MRAISLALLLLFFAGCGEDAGYATDSDSVTEPSLLVGNWISEGDGDPVQLAIDAELHMVATITTDSGPQTVEFDLTEQGGDLVLRDRVRTGDGGVEERRATQTYYVDFEVFIPLALRKTDDTEGTPGVYLARDDQHVEIAGEFILRARTETVLILDPDGSWVRTNTGSSFFEYDDEGEIRYLEPPLKVESQSNGTWEDVGTNQLRLVESEGAYDVTVPLRAGHLPSDDVFRRQAQ